MNIFLVCFLFFLWSSCFSLGKLALQYTSPVFLTSFRMILAGVILTGFLLIKKKSQFKLSKKKWLSLGLLGFFSIFLTNICEYYGLKHLSAAKTCFIYSLSPFFTILFSYLHFKEKLNIQKSLGLFIGFLGFIPVLFMQPGAETLFSLSQFFTLADLAVVGAALFSVYGWVLLRLLVKGQEMSPILANGVSMVLGGMMALLQSFFMDSWNPWPVSSGNFLPFFGIVAAMTITSNIICYNLYGYMLKKFTATFMSFAGLLSPIFASINGWILLGEKPSMIIFGSTAIVLIGLWIVYRTEIKQGYIQKSSI